MRDFLSFAILSEIMPRYDVRVAEAPCWSYFEKTREAQLDKILQIVSHVIAEFGLKLKKIRN
jgi:hypothetical protein